MPTASCFSSFLLFVCFSSSVFIISICCYCFAHCRSFGLADCCWAGWCWTRLKVTLVAFTYFTKVKLFNRHFRIKICMHTFRNGLNIRMTEMFMPFGDTGKNGLLFFFNKLCWRNIWVIMLSCLKYSSDSGRDSERRMGWTQRTVQDCSAGGGTAIKGCSARAANCKANCYLWFLFFEEIQITSFFRSFLCHADWLVCFGSYLENTRYGLNHKCSFLSKSTKVLLHLSQNFPNEFFSLDVPLLCCFGNR